MRQHIQSILSDALPATDFESDFLFSELDSLGIATIIAILSNEYDIKIGSTDITPKNFKTLDTLVKMVESKLSEK